MKTQTDYIFINHNGLSEKEIKSLILKKDKGTMKIISTAIAERKKEIERDLNNFQRTKAAAKEGNADVKYNLAFMYENGIGTAEDKVEAAKWYSLSAKEGNAEAQEMLNIINPNAEVQKQISMMYYKRSKAKNGTYSDAEEAFKWQSLAAEQGDAEAQENLAFMYFFGKGVAYDDEQAFKYFALAAEQGRDEAQEMLNIIKSAV